MAKNKVVTKEEALAQLHDGMTIMIGGFQNVGTPNEFVMDMIDAGLKDFTLIAIDAGNDKVGGIGALIVNKRVKHLVAAHVGLNPQVTVQNTAGELSVELVPMGTLAERVRCGGTGLGGVLTPTGVGTDVANGKQIINIDGKDYILETALHADVGLIAAHKADKLGNLVYRRAARNIDPWIAMASDFVIAQVEEIVDIGDIDPDEVMTSGTCVDMIVKY